MTQQGMNVLNEVALLVGGKPLNVLIFFDNSDRKAREGFYKTFYGAATLSITTLSIMTVSIKGLYVTLSIMSFKIKTVSIKVLSA
jgi:hypothetical protein